MTVPTFDHDPRFDARLQFILSEALAALSDEDRAARVAWCQSPGGHHGTTTFVQDDGVLRFEWGGAILTRVMCSVFEDDAYMLPLIRPASYRMPDNLGELLRDTEDETGL